MSVPTILVMTSNAENIQSRWRTNASAATTIAAATTAGGTIKINTAISVTHYRVGATRTKCGIRIARPSTTDTATGTTKCTNRSGVTHPTTGASTIVCSTIGT